jgi:CheY-like chemotaxis protein
MSNKKERVMVVDDDEVVLEVARERLESAGYEVITRSKAFGTSAAILREHPEFVLLDVNMPGLQGDTIARLLSAYGPAERPVVILHSSAGRNELMSLAQACGAVGVIEKTSSVMVFMQQFRACVAASRPSQSMPPCSR